MKNTVKPCLSTLSFKEMRLQGSIMFCVYWDSGYAGKHQCKKPTLVLSVMLILHRIECAHSYFYRSRYSSMKMKPGSAPYFLCKTTFPHETNTIHF